MRLATLWLPLVLASGCSGAEPEKMGNSNQTAAQAGNDAQVSSHPGVAGRWDLQSSGEGVALVLLDGSGSTALRLFCAADGDDLLVNVPSFRPVGSEERLSFGSDGEVVALVADTSGDRQRGGVSGTGPVPQNLAQLVAGQIAVNYGSQNSGPHAAPPVQQARAFAAACADGQPSQEPAAAPGEPAQPAEQPASACRTQDGQTLPAIRLRAIGTEPFWGARIDGRCVTYSHPENQSGARIWTKFSGSARSGRWTGFYENRRFVLRTRPQPGCSDGMSDNRYPIGVNLEVGGEQRSGCAEPL